MTPPLHRPNSAILSQSIFVFDHSQEVRKTGRNSDVKIAELVLKVAEILFSQNQNKSALTKLLAIFQQRYQFDSLVWL